MLLPEPRHRLFAQRAVHRMALDQDARPFLAQVGDAHHAHAGGMQPAAVVGFGGDLAEAHAVEQPACIVVAEAFAAQNVREHQPAAGLQHARDAGHQGRLVGDVRKGLLADGQREAGVGEGQRQRIALAEAHARGQPSGGGQRGGAFDAAGRQVDARDLATRLPGDVTRRPAHAAADVEHPVRRLSRRPARSAGRPRRCRRSGPGRASCSTSSLMCWRPMPRAATASKIWRALIGWKS